MPVTEPVRVRARVSARRSGDVSSSPEGERGHAATGKSRSRPAVAAIPGVGTRDARVAPTDLTVRATFEDSGYTFCVLMGKRCAREAADAAERYLRITPAAYLREQDERPRTATHLRTARPTRNTARGVSRRDEHLPAQIRIPGRASCPASSTAEVRPWAGPRAGPVPAPGPSAASRYGTCDRPWSAAGIRRRRSSGETFEVTATVFREGHDAVAANVVLTRSGGPSRPVDPDARTGPRQRPLGRRGHPGRRRAAGPFGWRRGATRWPPGGTTPSIKIPAGHRRRAGPGGRAASSTSARPPGCPTTPQRATVLAAADALARRHAPARVTAGGGVRGRTWTRCWAGIRCGIW